MKKENLKKLTLSAMFLSLGFVLPFFTGQIPQIGSTLLPMHIPVFLCAFTCGPGYAAPIAFILPLLRSLIFGVPVFYPDAIAIAFEMSTYALVAGLEYNRSSKESIKTVYRSMITAMILGRIVRIIAQLFLLKIHNTPFTLGTLLAGIVIRGIPGIILQLIIIPLIMIIINRTTSKKL